MARRHRHHQALLNRLDHLNDEKNQLEDQVCNLFELLEEVSIEAANNKRRIASLENTFGTALVFVLAFAGGVYLATGQGSKTK